MRVQGQWASCEASCGQQTEGWSPPPLASLFPAWSSPRVPSLTSLGCWPPGDPVGQKAQGREAPRSSRAPIHSSQPPPGARFPAHLGPNLVAALAGLQVHDLAHGGGAAGGRGGGGADAGSCGGGAGGGRGGGGGSDDETRSPSPPACLYKQGWGPRHGLSPARSAPWSRPGTERAGVEEASHLETSRGTRWGPPGPRAPPPRALAGRPVRRYQHLLLPPLPAPSLVWRLGFCRDWAGEGRGRVNKHGDILFSPPRPGRPCLSFSV